MAPVAALALFASPAAAAKKGPDLKVSMLAAAGSPAPGTAFRLQLAVKNAGKKTAKASQTAVVLSKDAKRSADDRALAAQKVKALKPRKAAKASLKLTVPAAAVAGSYRVVACADAKKKVKETSEKNNCKVTALTVVPVTMSPGSNPAVNNPGGTPATGTSTGTGTGGEPTPTPTATPTPTVTATPTPTATPTRTPDPFPKPPLPVPPAPAPAAPPPTESTSVADSTEFLYTGADPIQKEVDAGTIAPRRVAVLRGKVLDTAGTAISGARVTVLDHPEFGYTATRADGGYDLAVNGGQDFVLQFEQQGFMTLQRTEQVPWQDFVRLEDVVMTRYSSTMAPVAQDARSITAVTSATTPADDAAQRKATLMFDPGTDATMTLPSGEEKPLDNTMQVAATEYTVGAGGEQRMPGELPDTSAYTYAVEFSVDQATQAAAVDVEFTKPVATYVDNFLKFEAGTTVPAAYYDKDKAAWVPSRNGIVLAIVGETGGMADLDLGGSSAADPARYAGLGIDDAERTKLAQQYDAGASLWRVQVTHFTPWDYNWPYGCKQDCPPPDEEPPPPPYCPECEAAGSIVGVFNQTLGERVNVTGTPFALHYDSSRAPGYEDAYSVEIPLTDSSPPGGLLSVELQVTIAGREFNQSFAPSANRRYTFTWDGKDAYGRTLEGAQTARARIGYTYRAVYLQPDEFEASFAQFGGAAVSRNDGGGAAGSRRSITVWQQWERPLGTLGAGSDALGGWTVDVHHSYDPQSRTLYLGDGTRVNTEAIRSEIHTVAGIDPFSEINGDTPATQSDLGNVRGIAPGPDGGVYIAESSVNRVIEVTPAGNVAFVAGGGFGADPDDLGDGGQAAQARLVGPSDVAVAQDGTLYISDTGDDRIRKVAPDGVISTIAGGGDPDRLGDDGPATSASLHAPRGLALTDDGTLYVAESGADRVRRITPDGRIATAAGGGSPASGVGDGDRAVDATLDRPTDVAVDSAGTLYVADADHGRVRAITPTGTISTLAGTGSAAYSGDGGPAAGADLGVPTAVAAGRDGSIYVADRIHHVVRRIAANGTIVRYAGTRKSGGDGDGGAPLQAQLSFPQALAIAPDASLLIADAGNSRVRRASVGLPGFTDADFSLPSQDGTEVFLFNRDGRHLRTLDALTGRPRYVFGYDAASRLTSITECTDASAAPTACAGNVTTIARDAGGAATGIVAPGSGGGRTSALTIGAGGHLTAIANPLGERTELTYKPAAAGDPPTGLLQTFKDPLLKTATFGYDPAGLLVSDRDRGSQETTYARTRTADGVLVTRTAPSGRLTTYRTESLTTGGTRTTVTEPSGAATVTAYGSDGTTKVTAADGTVTTAKAGPDPRWGMRAPIPAEVTTRLPSGATRTVKRERTVQLTTQGDPFAIAELTDTSEHAGGGRDTMTYDGATRVASVRSAQGRTFTTTIDALGRPVERATDGADDPIALRWNARGRVDRVTQGTQQVTLAYDAAHPYRLLGRTDGENHATAFTYDAAERIKTVELPSGALYQYGYDAGGNRTSLVMPNAHSHGYGFDALGRATSYTPAAGAAFGRAFDADGISTGFSLPGGGGETLQRQPSGRLSGASSPDGTASAFTYAAGDATDRLATATRTLPGSRSDETRLGYDGPLLASKQSRDAGGAYATSTFAYDDRLQLERIDLAAGGSSQSQGIFYDADGLVVRQGPFSFDRNGPAGLTSEITGEGLSLAIGYASTGTQARRTTTVDGAPVFETEITRDDAGRITQKVEKTGPAAAVTYAYGYTPDGQLQSVRGGSVEDYLYDGNGNRTSAKRGAAAAQAATYSDDDRMTARNGTAHTYDAAGRLATRGADTFDYSDSGELLQATAGGVNVKYVYDTAGRQVARIQGTDTTRFVYGDPRRPLLVTASIAPGGEPTRYSYDADDLLFSLERGDQRYFVATDQVGTPRAIADATGAIVERIPYDAYGVRGTATGTFGDIPIGFAGGIEDPVTKLVRFGLRDYDPAAGRWTARDPIYQAGGPNTYVYVMGNPVEGRDPMGLEGFWSGVATAVGNFFTSDHAGTALETVNAVAGDTAIGEAAGTLNDGIGKVQQVQEVLDTALELKEASEQPTDPEQAAGYLKCGLKWIKKILPIDLVGTEAAAAVLDKGMEHARDQRDFGTINRGAQSQMSQIEW